MLALVAQGLSNHDVARRMGLAEKTVKHYVTAVLAKLQVRSRVEAALLAHHIPLPKDEAGSAAADTLPRARPATRR